MKCRSFLVLTALFMLLSSSGLLFGYEWPLENPTVVLDFCQNNGKAFLPGAMIQGSSNDVRAVESGKLIYFQREDEALDQLPSGYDSFIVLEHERGIRSFYGNLGTVKVSHVEVEKGETLGTLLLTASGNPSPLFLQILDYEYLRYVNPLLSLPPLEDSLAPIISGVLLSRGDQTITLNREARLEAGRWEVFVSAFDPVAGSRDRKAPYRFDTYLNGESQGDVSFETLEMDGDSLKLIRTGNLTADRLYQRSGYYRIGEIMLSPGASTLEVAVSDFAGNETSHSILLRVR